MSKKNMTLKQAVKQASSFVNGITSSMNTINKHQKVIEEKTADLRSILSGLTIMEATAAAKPEKVAKPAKEKAAKPVKEKPAKAAKPAKEKAAKPAKAAAADKKTAPTVKSVIAEILKSKGKQTKPDLYKMTEKYGTWSRQSFYNALKDPMFGESDGCVTLAVTPKEKTTEVKTSDEEADRFVSKVENDGATAAVV